MAGTTTVANLQANLSLNTDGFSSGVNNAAGATNNLTASILKADAVKFALQGVANFAGIVTNTVKQSIGNFSEYEQLVGGIETLFGTGGKSFEDWSKSYEKSSDMMEDYIETARKVINGDFGTGDKRIDLLSAAGYNPEVIQQMVNNLVNGVDIASGISTDKISANMQTAEEKYQSLEAAQAQALENAQNAFKTAGMSANDYMTNVTAFAASLNQSLGGDTEKSVKIADMAIQDMADNANKMGTDISSIQNAYQGFAKQNYTMLDNLKLGYGGTKQEMERLLEDAEKLTGVEYDINNLSDVFEAIHAIQEELDITGTTSKEAATTIQGSTKMMKSAWSNMLTSMVTGGEYFDKSLEGLIESVEIFVDNISPALQGALKGVAALISRVAPEIVKLLPGMVEDVLPGFIDAVKSIINSILEALPTLLKALESVAPLVSAALVDLIPSLINFILEGIPLMISAGTTLLKSLVSGLADSIDTIVPQLTQGIVDLCDQIIKIAETDGKDIAKAGLTLLSNLANALVDSVPDMLTQFTQLIQDLTTNIKTAAENEDDSFASIALTILKNLASNLSSSVAEVLPDLTSAMAEFISEFAGLASDNTTELANTAITILNTLITNLSGSIPTVMTDLTAAALAIVEAIVDAITGIDTSKLLEGAVVLVKALADGLVDSVDKITEKLPELITKIGDWFTSDNMTSLIDSAAEIINALADGLLKSVNKIIEVLPQLILEIVSWFSPENMSNLADGAAKIIGNLADGITDSISLITAKLPELITGLVAWLTNPDNLSGMVSAALDIFGSIVSNVPEILESLATGLAGIVTGIAKYFTDNKEEILEGFKTAFADIGAKFTEVWDEKIKPAFDKLGDDIRGWLEQFEWGQAVLDFLGKLKDGISKAWDTVKEAFEGSEGLGEKIKNFFSQFEWGEALVNFLDSIKNGITGLWDKVKESFEGGEGLGAKIKNFFSNFNWGISLTTFVNGIGNAINNLWDTIKDAFTGENGFFGKVKSWIGNLSLTETMSGFVDSIKKGINDGWESFKSWFTSLFTSLFDNIELPDWLKFWNWGKGDKKDNSSETGKEEESLIDMPEGMVKLDYSNLQPVSDDVLTSYQALAEAIKAINAAMTGQAEGAEEGAEEGSVGLLSALELIPEMLQKIMDTAKTLADYLTGDFLTAMAAVAKALAIVEVNDAGETNASGGNTLYTSLGAVFGVLKDILTTSQNIAAHWKGEMLDAVKELKKASGTAKEALDTMKTAANSAMQEFSGLAGAIHEVIDAIGELSGMEIPDLTGGLGGGGGTTTPQSGSSTPPSSGKSRGGTDRVRASGGPVSSGITYLVGEEGPELYTPTRNGYIIPNDELVTSSGGDTNITVAFYGDVIGDEESISGYVERATRKAIQEEVYAAV